MRLFTNSYVDFYGTLVRENSSRVLKSLLFERARTRRQKAVTWWCEGPLSRLANLGFIILGMLMGGIDARLLVVLWAYRDLLAHQGLLIFREAAQRLTLNQDVLFKSEQPIAIISLGLTPVIEAFLELHPEIKVSKIVASQFSASRRGPKVHLNSIADKIKHIPLGSPAEYYTDYLHEVQMLQAIYSHISVSKLQLPEAGLIYKVERKHA
jgi:hypothetical protein